jgi:hypothetical protein
MKLHRGQAAVQLKLYSIHAELGAQSTAGRCKAGQQHSQSAGSKPMWPVLQASVEATPPTDPAASCSVTSCWITQHGGLRRTVQCWGRCDPEACK